jgi:hypothetical protein
LSPAIATWTGGSVAADRAPGAGGGGTASRAARQGYLQATSLALPQRRDRPPARTRGQQAGNAASQRLASQWPQAAGQQTFQRPRDDRRPASQYAIRPAARATTQASSAARMAFL